MDEAEARARMNVAYDAGMFDKDEQGWCSSIHELRVEGDVLHVRRHGDRNGRDPFDSTMTFAIGAIDLDGEVVEMASGYLFDLRAQRLISGMVSVSEEVATTRRPEPSSLEAFATSVLRVHRAIGLVPEGPLHMGELLVQVSPLEATHRVRSGRVFSGDHLVAVVQDTVGPSNDVIGVNVRAGADAGLSVSWQFRTPDRLGFYGHVEVTRLASLRRALRMPL